MSGLINIYDRIDSRLNLWKKGAYSELVQDSHKALEEALGNKRVTQTQEQHHRNICRKVCKAVCFICKRDTGGVYYPANGQLKERSLRVKPSRRYWRDKIHPRKNPQFYIGSVGGNACFYPRGNYGGCGRVGRAIVSGE